MEKKWGSWIAAMAMLLIVIGLSQPAQAEAARTEQINQSIRQIVEQKLAGGDVSIAIRDRTTGRLLYEYNGEKPIKPASNMKLITGAAALEALGQDYRFTTGLYTNGTLNKGVLTGDVYLKGEGDPTLSIEDLKQFAQELKSKGINKIDGRLVGDDKWFDNVRLTPGIWAEDEPYYFAAPISALTTSPNSNYDSGTVIIDVSSSTIGQPPAVQVIPHQGDLEIVNEAVTVAAGNSNTVTIARPYQTNRIMISGNLPVNQTSGGVVTVQNPTAHTLTMFAAVLSEAGIEYTGEKLFREATPKKAKLVAMKKSMPLEQLLIPYMKMSNNGIADILIKTIGKVQIQYGSTHTGLKAVRSFCKSIGLHMNNWYLEDGSGMSHANNVSGNELSDLLFKVQKKNWFPSFYKSLPVSGNPEKMVGGTLRKRLNDPMTAGKVIAKTGSLDGVSTLSGYLESSSGKQYIFSVLVQNKEGSGYVIDEIVRVMASGL
ncbi:D-alanyl-D-alanine carboxypeptidase/D-alanyl-D-alanine-endopeptidase [Bacillus sp. AGMB 02131]|uniref:D-alanyl-D-alanine carboxypeptidase/D-alanyl-D-alanine-endopeptidase n=1 Tax=Peribacillus faecalis TaxID=2772559 RepID=A0A927CUD2_9BACI|nr:D-alanyl-D-alanine carboxypeptidase/D-alanyl-D-alanine-endopeptidase [Peribacillus faecalis]MBD3107987.1 D-alanyl-D-alanine carboxypeptidase/D-alanyl-D-alanine-endopeptidase [Peribacillus faecalis]